MKKYKVTYFKSTLLEVEIESSGLYMLMSDMMSKGIYDWEVISIELIPQKS